MDISISPETNERLRDRMKRSGFLSPDQAVLAGLAALEQQDTLGDFEPGEMDRLLAGADAEIERGEVVDGEQVFAELREKSARLRNKAG